MPSEQALSVQSPLHPWAWPTVPWERVHADFAGPVMGKMLFVVTDTHSKWPEVCVMDSTTSSNTIFVLREMFARYGLPRQVVSDNGPQFTSEEFKQFLHANGVKHITTAPHHNGSLSPFEQWSCRTASSDSQAGHSCWSPERRTSRAYVGSISAAVSSHPSCHYRCVSRCSLLRQATTHLPGPLEARYKGPG